MTQPIHPTLERVARAIANGNSTPDWYAAHDPEPWLSMARAAIEALLEPDEGMIREMLAVEWPATFRTHLRHPDAGPVSAQETERLIEREKRRVQAMLKPLLGDEG